MSYLSLVLQVFLSIKCALNLPGTILLASDDNMVKIWDASSGECLQTLEVGKVLFDVSFDATGSYLHTKIGTIAINAILVLDTTPCVVDPQIPRYQGVGLSSDRAWITYNSENLVVTRCSY